MVIARPLTDNREVPRLGKHIIVETLVLIRAGSMAALACALSFPIASDSEVGIPGCSL
jgi:hypothetical protein